MSLETELMSVHDAALMLNVDRSRVNVLLKQGRLVGAAKIGRNWVIPRKSVENFRRLPPGGSKNLQHQHEEDKRLISNALQATQSGVNADVARGEER